MVNELKPVYLITGSDYPKIALAVKRLKGRFPSEVIEEVTGDQSPDSTSGEATVAILNSLGLFGAGERLVVVRGMGSWKKGDVEAVTTYLNDPASHAVLALVGTPPRAGGLIKSCSAAGDVLRFDVPTRTRGSRLDYPTWVKKQFERYGVNVDSSVAKRLVEVVGENSVALENEVAKIATWAAGEAVGIYEVERLAVASSESSIFALTDAWGMRDRKGIISAAFAAVEEEGEEPFLQGLRVSNQVSKVRGARRILDAGGTIQDVASDLKIKEYPARKAAQFSDNYTVEELDEAVVRLARLDFDLKGGSPLNNGSLQLERALLDISFLRSDD